MVADRALDQLDTELVQRATAGDANAVDEIVRNLSKPFYNLALRMLHNHHDAEDAAQEAIIRVVTNLSSFRSESRFSTWAWSVATRSMLNFRDGQARRNRISPDAFATDLADGLASTSTPDPETSAILAQVKLGCGRAMLLTLDADLRIAYALGEILGVDHNEAASALDITPAAFRKRLSRARTKLQAVLTKNCGIANPNNPCRCHKRRDKAIELGRLEPRDAVSVDIAALNDTVRQLDEIDRAAAYFQADPTINATEHLLPTIRTILNAT
jgi:RNA polymerase sigma factor (sigma-70 family)